MRVAHRILLSAVLILIAFVPPAAAINIILEPLSGTTHPQILDGTFTFDEEPPAFDATSAGLLSILNSIAADYEDVFEDAATIRITYWWDADMTFCCGQSIPALMREDGNGNLTHSIVRINPTVAYYIDPTPNDDTEYTMAQRLYNFGPNALTPQQQTARFTGNVPNLFEAGYNGAVVPDSAADGGLRDLLTLAYQEMGHSIGMNAGFIGVTNGGGTGEVDDGDYDVNPNFVNGNVMAMLPRGGTQDPLDHLQGVDAVMASLNISTERTRPSAADYFAIAATQGWTNIDLPRQDFLGGGDWHTGFNWMGGQVPGAFDAAYVRHGGAVSLSGGVTVDSLLVDNASTVSTGANNLFVSEVVTIQNSTAAGTPRILVGAGGVLNADIINVDDDARLDVFGGTVDMERFNIRDGGELRGNGTVDISDLLGELINDGIIRGSGDGLLTITSDNNLALDLDGNNENGEVIAVAGNIHFDPGLDESFNGDMTVGAGREISFGTSFGLGAGGLLLLDGAPADPATVSGGLLFINSAGVVRADDLGVIENPIILGTGGIIETEITNPSSEIRLNGATYLNGGHIIGTGTARQNGEVFAGLDTVISIDTYDMDGQAGNTVINISAGATLDINSDSIDTTAGNDFDGTLNVMASTLDILTAWQLDGTLNLNGTVEGDGASDEGDGIARLLGAGGVTVANLGTINMTGVAHVETAADVINGLVFVDGEGEFSGPTTFGVNADVEIDDADDTLRLRGNTVFVGPSIVGSGRLILEDSVNVAFVNTSIGVAETDLDGLLGNTQILVNSGLTFSISSITIEPTANDGFDGVITNRGTFSVLAGWRLDGDLEMEPIGANVATLAGLGTFRIHTTGTFSTNGDAVIEPPTEVAGAMIIDNGLTQVNNTISFESTAVVMVDADAELELNGNTTFAGGSYTDDGLIQLNAPTSVVANTTISTGRVDLDGAAENTHTMLVNSALVLNVTSIDVSNNLFAGTVDVVGSAARLEVNLANPLTAWRLTSAGVLEFNTPSAIAVTMLDGSDLAAEGDMNVTGRARFAANVGVSGRLDTLTATTDVHFGSGGQNFIFNTATVSGPGSMTIENGTRMHLDDATLVGIDVENAGRLEVGLVASEVGIDLSAPGEATVRSTFAQTNTGTFAVNLAGYVQGDEYDLLTITEDARLNGTIEVSLIDGFAPVVGDMFQVLTAANVIGTFDSVVALDAEDLLGLVVTPLYSITDVVVRIDDVFLLGDYNDDGTVNAADYTVWRNNLGAPAGTLLNDGDGGVIGQAQYATWKSNFGATLGSGSGSFENVAVPEPSIATILVCGLIFMNCRRLWI